MKNIYHLLQRSVQRCDEFFTARKILLLAFGIAFFWMLVFFFFNDNIYRDVANCYAWYAREYGRGFWRGEAIAQLPPLLIFISGWIARLGVEAFQATILVSAIFYILTILPLYFLLKMFLSERCAAWGVLLFVLTPKIIRLSGSGVLESVRNFFLVLSVLLLFYSWQNKFLWKKWIALGVSLGFLSLSRGEGILMAGLLCIAFWIRPIQVYSSIKSLWGTVILPFCVVIFCMVAVLLPRLVETYQLTGYPVHDARAIGGLQSIPGINRIFHQKALHFEQKAVEISEDNESDIPPCPEKNSVILMKKLAHLPSSMSRGCYEVYLIFAGLGICFLLAQRKWQSEFTFLLLFSVIASLSFIFYAMEYRYFIFLVPLWMVFIIHGIIGVKNLLSCVHLSEVFLLGISILFLLQPLNAVSFLKETKGIKARRMADFIHRNRQQFTRPGHDKIVMYDCYAPEVVYWCDEDRLKQYGEKVPELSRVGGFDLLVVDGGKKELGKKALKRRDLQLVEHPYGDDYLLFCPKEEK